MMKEAAKIKKKLLPKKYHCVFTQGLARGTYLQSPPKDSKTWKTLQKSLKRFEKDCKQAVWLGIGWGAFLLHNEDPEAITAALEKLKPQEKKLRQLFYQAKNWFSGIRN